MADIKEMSFILLVLLVAVSGVYEWSLTDTVLQRELGIGLIEGFKSTTLSADVETLRIESDNLISTVISVDLLHLVSALQAFFSTIWSIFMKLMFGWVELVRAIFDSVELEGLDVVFIGPLAVIEALAALYFLRDIVNTVRGVS